MNKLNEIEIGWRRILKKISGRRVDVVFYLGSTVKWISIPKTKNSLWSAYKLNMHNAFVDQTEKGYEIYLPVMIMPSNVGGGWLADAKLHDVLTQDQFTEWVKKINEFPYV